MLRARDRGILVATAVCAVGVPVSAAAWVSARTHALADQLSAAGGVAAQIGTIDADLTGTIRLSDVAFGPLIAADAIEASVALDSLLAGTLRADEIRVAGPRVQVQVDGDGDSDLSRLARRLMSHGRAAARDDGERDGDGDGKVGHRLRRIVVSSGTLAAHVAGVGDVVADGVELVPDGDGFRVITGAVQLDGRAGPLEVSLRFTRAAAELALPHLRFGRVLAVGGSGIVAGPEAEMATGGEPTTPTAPVADADDPRDRQARLRDVVVGRLAADGTLELRASLDDGGISRPLAIDVEPRDRAIRVRGEHLPLRALAGLAPRGVELAAAHASGALVVHRDAARTTLEIDGALDGAALDHRALAPVPIPLSAQVQASIAISAEAISVSRAAFSLGAAGKPEGAARWTASGWWRRGSPASGQLELALASTPCSDLLASLPVELRGPLDGMVLGGALGGHVRLAIDLAAPAGDGVGLTASVTDGCRSEAEPPAADVARLTAAGDQVFADGSHARIGPGEPGWLAVRHAPAYVAGAFVSAEDSRFYDHAGFDLTQIAKSLEINLREHRLARGGSTISQQLVKNAFLSQRRSFDRKLQEAILTWRLEARLDKPQILERYLNIIELGPRVFGVTAAARHWFDAAPRELTVRQAAFLAALTSEPSSMSRRVRRAGGLDPDSAARVDIVLRAMRRDGVIDAGQLEAAKAAPLRFAAPALKQER
jgi:hypothetical protein